eukprot:TRINITY_DN2673_c0_g1_i2.p1 TRINITY_DN2673_c0_g1~~TRINITY_DN2673_c0_g1_i2.p1  ORF type:complete len:125 (+),score=22.84 TRINITY_DN2673_c0_g1_i2:183-557(+)
MLTDVTGFAIASCTKLVELQLHGCVLLSTKVLNRIVQECLDLIVVGFSGLAVTDETIDLLLRQSPKKCPKKRFHTLLFGYFPPLPLSPPLPLLSLSIADIQEAADTCPLPYSLTICHLTLTFEF